MAWIYAGFIGFVLAMLFVDLRIFHTSSDRPSLKKSGAWVAVWVTLAVAFGAIVYLWKGPTSTVEYFTGYLLEYSLSVDNMFVFLVVFNYFKVPIRLQHRVLFFGILGAIVFRGLFIVAGAALIHRFEWVLYIFGALLLWAAYRLIKGQADVDPEDNPVLKYFRRHFRTSPSFEGQRFFVHQGGRRLATPLFVVLIVIETTDIFFAVDSIPAVFGITRDPFIVLTSNVFAVLGLRALYFLLAGGMARFRFLHYGLALILGFIGVKMLIVFFEIEIPVWLSLVAILGILTVTVIASLKIPPKTPPPVPGGGIPEISGEGPAV